MRLAAVSVDLDEIPCYAAIHGIDAPDPGAVHAVYRVGVPRFEALFAGLGVSGTFFAIGSDLDDAAAASAVRRLHRSGHEIGNHSLSHLYDLTRRSDDVMRREVAGGQAAVRVVTGEAPSGFRAPGYTTNNRLLELLAQQGLRYDSSVFPCPGYYAAKAAAITAYGLLGRPSHSVIDDPRVLRCPADPYRLGRPYYRRGAGLWELPIGVTSAATGRLPYIGTALTMAGPRGSAWLSRRMIGRPLVNLELHGIDLLDASDGLEFLAPHQPDLARPLAHKRACLLAALNTLRDAGYEFVTLNEAVQRLAASS
jgi:hypothetical protein